MNHYTVAARLKAREEALKMNALEDSVRAAIKQIPNAVVYQWFGMTLTGASTKVRLTVEMDTRSASAHALNKPKLKDYPNVAAWKEATSQHYTHGKEASHQVAKQAADALVAAGFKITAWSDYGWAKLDIITK